MTYPRILERDTQIIDWRARLGGWGTGGSGSGGTSYAVRSDGLLHVSFATLDVFSSTVNPAVNIINSVGVHLTGPDPGDEFTPYSISCMAHTTDPDVIPMLFLGESPASITSDSAGNTVTEIRHIALGESPGPNGSVLMKDMTIICPEKTAGRGLCIAIGMMAGPNTAPTNNRCYARLSVRRLFGVHPPIIDTRKQ